MKNDHTKKKRHRADKFRAGVLDSLEECAYRLDFMIECVSKGSDLSKSSCAREGLAITLRDLQERISSIRGELQVSCD